MSARAKIGAEAKSDNGNREEGDTGQNSRLQFRTSGAAIVDVDRCVLGSFCVEFEEAFAIGTDSNYVGFIIGWLRSVGWSPVVGSRCIGVAKFFICLSVAGRFGAEVVC